MDIFIRGLKTRKSKILIQSIMVEIPFKTIAYNLVVCWNCDTLILLIRSCLFNVTVKMFLFY